jgi:exosortase
VGAYAYISWFEATSLLVTLAGLCCLWGGWACLRWTWPAILFLIFMVPLPFRVETALGTPLQRMATVASTYLLQCFGLPAFSSGNTILLDDFRIGVVDACNGLGMSYMFLALSVAAVLLIHRPTLDKLLIVASAVPIALAANLARITAAGLMHEVMGKRVADAVYHDLAGWLMMLLTIGILFIECRLLSLLFIEPNRPQGNPGAAGQAARPPGEHAVSAGRMKPVIPLLVGTASFLGFAIVDGLWTNRWKTSQELRHAVSCLDRVPMAIGDWRARPETLDPQALEQVEVDGGVLRRYENSRTGRTISLILVCGRPGPVVIHTPELCFPGAGYEQVRAKSMRLMVHPDRLQDPDRFLLADFVQHESFPPDRLRIYWSWKAKGRWDVLANPLVTFAPQPFLYKLYLVHRTSPGFEQAEDDSLRDFLGRLLPELDRSLPTGVAASPDLARLHR